MNLMKCPVLKMPKNEQMQSLYEAAGHVDVVEAVEDLQVEVAITMDHEEEDEEEDDTNIKDPSKVLLHIVMWRIS